MNLHFFVVFTFLSSTVASTGSDEISALLNHVQRFKETSWRIVNDGYKHLAKREKELFDGVLALDKRFTSTSGSKKDTYVTTFEEIDNVLTRSGRVIGLLHLNRKIALVLTAYKELTFYANMTTEIERATLGDFAESILINEKDSMRIITADIHYFIVTSGQNSLVTMLTNALKDLTRAGLSCQVKQSPQQLLYNLYDTILITELKAQVLIQVSHMILKMYGQGTDRRSLEVEKIKFEERLQNTTRALRGAMKETSGDLWRCDPTKHVEGETYLEITQLLQGYVQNEADLNAEKSCRASCEEYKETKSYSCDTNVYCREQRRCEGKIRDCRFVDSKMSVCLSDEASTHRRYEYLDFRNGQKYGQKGNCSTNEIQVNSWQRWFYQCQYCFCLCDEEGIFSDRYISMRPVVSTVIRNNVVTGLRFVKDKRVIHLQIQEGEMLSYGIINTTSVRWVPVAPFEINEPSVVRNRDYFALSWEERSIALDEVRTSSEHVITGVRFRKIGAHLTFQILETPFNMATGKLQNQNSVWRYTANTGSYRLSLHNADIPTRTTSPSIIDSKSNEYVEFTHTDIEKDAAQTTIPFFDAHPVNSSIPVPLIGAGIYHKGRNGFGGFIAPKIVTFDYSNYLINVN